MSADSKRPAQDSVPGKDEEHVHVHNNGRANKAVENLECCKHETQNGGKRRVKCCKNEQWRKAPGGAGTITVARNP